MKILATKGKKVKNLFFTEHRAHAKCTVLNQAKQSKQKKSMCKTELLLKRRYSTKFFFKTKWKQERHFAILKWKLLFDTLKLVNQILRNRNRIINYLKQWDCFLKLKTTATTLSDLETIVRLCYFLQKRTKTTHNT